MADARVTIALAREDRERIDALTREIKALRAEMAVEPGACPHLVDVLEGVGAEGARWSKRCLALATHADGDRCGRCAVVSPAQAPATAGH